MKKYFEYWKNRIAEVQEREYQEFCRDSKPEEFSVFIFSSETTNNGPCFMSSGAWLWHTDINILASWVIEFQLRNIFSCCEEGREITDTLDVCGADYLAHIAATFKGDESGARSKVAALAKELDCMIYAGKLTIDKFKDWLNCLAELSVDMPVSVDYEIFDNISEAAVLLLKHEVERGGGVWTSDMYTRLLDDVIC